MFHGTLSNALWTLIWLSSRHLFRGSFETALNQLESGGCTICKGNLERIMPRYLVHIHAQITPVDNCQLANGAHELVMRALHVLRAGRGSFGFLM
jgi:hypothetical protein